MNPSDLAWWHWLLVALGLWILVPIFGKTSEEYVDGAGETFFGFLATVSVLAGALAVLIGSIRFIKWVWAG